MKISVLMSLCLGLLFSHTALANADLAKAKN